MTPKEKALKKFMDANDVADPNVAFTVGWDASRERQVIQEARENFRALILKYGCPVPNGKTWAALAADAFTAARAFREVAEGVENA